MRILAVLFLWYPLFGVPAIVGGLIGWAIFRKRITLLKTDWLMLVFPWLVWISFMIIDGSGKSLSNLIEAIILGAITGVFFTLRLAIEASMNGFGQQLSKAALLVSCISAVALWAFIPALPE